MGFFSQRYLGSLKETGDSPALEASVHGLISPTPLASDGARTDFALFDPPELVDEVRAPDWILSHTMWRRDSLVRWQGQYAWLYRFNHRRTVPRISDESRGYFAGARAYRELEDGGQAYLLDLLGDSYRFKILVQGLEGVADDEPDKSHFVLRIATTEYQPVEWQRKTVKNLADRLGISIGQIELTVPPQEPALGDEWVKGTTLNPIRKN